ncbi:MAG: peptidase [Acidobacteriaceae bacterium]|nr:peptidase [Acidobacteriaceae bacterium]
MIRIFGIKFVICFCVFTALCAAGAAGQEPKRTSEAQHNTVRYTISLAQTTNHLVRISIDLPAGAPEQDLQLPVWNALYQVRDFARYVNWVKTTHAAGDKLTVRKMNKNLWRVSGAEHGGQVNYEVFANDPGPYGAELNPQHAFFNLAELLMYPVDSRSASVQLSFSDVPSDWRIATPLAGSFNQGFTADNYDQMVDSPVEMGTFQESDFDEGGGHYRVIVDASPSDYDMTKIVWEDRSIVAAATTWMNDRPFNTYVFLYHFPHLAGGGGMEHAYCTAIDLPAQVLKANPQALSAVTAHEFFHLWNVKRIRPQSLEPIDYTKENYTTALWFSEGVTSTVEDIILSRAGLLDETHYLNRIAGEIRELESRPAHLTQSAEESSLDAWLEKYDYYRMPQRSISYYNKGELLGVLLDLAVRDASNGSESLREVFQWMNQNYAKEGRYFADSDGVEQAAESVSHADLEPFFEKYVRGTDEIPWNAYFKSVGLQVIRQTLLVADAGFSATRDFNKPPVVSVVAPDTEAAHAGLIVGDSILEINHRVTGPDFEQLLSDLHPGDTIYVRVRHDKTERELQWKVGSREEINYELKDLEHISPQQRTRRTAWLIGESETKTEGAHP